MSTRSYIAMKTGENTYRAVYCHYDGYLEYNGRMLLEHYNTQERVEKLLNLGCISSLKEKLEPEAGSHHCFDTPDEDVTVFYGRDRGEKGQEAFVCTEKQLKDPHSWINFIYVFDNGTWYYSEIERNDFSEFRPLAPAIQKINEKENLKCHLTSQNRKTKQSNS